MRRRVARCVFGSSSQLERRDSASRSASACAESADRPPKEPRHRHAYAATPWTCAVRGTVRPNTSELATRSTIMKCTAKRGRAVKTTAAEPTTCAKPATFDNMAPRRIATSLARRPSRSRACSSPRVIMRKPSSRKEKTSKHRTHATYVGPSAVFLTKARGVGGASSSWTEYRRAGDASVMLEGRAGLMRPMMWSTFGERAGGRAGGAGGGGVPGGDDVGVVRAEPW
mmetsp:Transcript_13947/g.41545  ORF Transcript_13947/g.41545 Transcript_13947/m.41545 type:complete len:227 (+) Transcript_13947:371-1051(+)